MLVTNSTITWINKKFARGNLINKSTLDFAVKAESARFMGNLPHLVRALLVDHCFEDGNKRTAAYLILKFCEENKISINQEKLIKSIWEISRSTPKSIEKIRSKIKYAIS